jgi:DNA-binding MarR family transcriptional regulator
LTLLYLYIQVYLRMRKTAKSITPDIIGENCFNSRLRLLNRVVSKIYNDALRPHGLTASQLNILVLIARRTQVSPADVCNRLKMDISTLSRNVDRMKAQGWIIVETDPDDARAHSLRLSAQGRRLIEKSSPAWEEAQAKVEDLIGHNGVIALVKAAEKIRA